MKTTLDKLNINDKARIIRINNSSDIKRRLLDIGLIEGSIISIYLKSPFNDPIAYNIKNAIIAIRNNDSKNIEVEVL